MENKKKGTMADEQIHIPRVKLGNQGFEVSQL